MDSIEGSIGSPIISPQACWELCCNGRHENLRHVVILFLSSETGRDLKPVRYAKTQAKFPRLFKYPHGQDGETLAGQEQNEPSGSSGWQVQDAPGLVAAFGSQSQDGIRMAAHKS